MRNAAANFDDDFGIDDAPRRKAPRKKASTSRKKKKARRFAFDMHRVARYGAIGMSATVATAIMVNALMLQKGRHPAPLFGNAIQLAQAPTPAPVAAKVTAPSVAPAAEADTTPRAASIPTPVAKPHHLGNEGAPPKPSDDPIARLLKTSTGDTSDKGETKLDSKTVMGVQRALVKLGFVLKPNGTFGPQTRKAIEIFEKDRHLPVRSDIDKRTVKIIAAESGLKID